MDISHSRHYFFLGLLFVILGLNAVVFSPFVGTLIFAATFAVLTNPWHKKILSVMPKWPGLAAFFTIILVFFAIITPFIVMGALIFNQAQGLYLDLINNPEGNSALHGMVDFLSARLPFFVDSLSLLKSISVYAEQGIGYVIGHLGSVFSGVATVGLNIFISLAALFFFLRDGEHFRRALLNLSPLHDADDVTILNHLDRVINSVIKGALLVAVIQGVLAGLGYFIFGVTAPALWGAATAVTALIPGIGTAVIFVPAVLYLYVAGHGSAALGLLIWGVIIVGGIDNILKPQLISNAVGIHPFLILLSVLGGLSIFGIYGFLLGPLLLGLMFALFDLYKKGVAPHIHSDTGNI